MSESTANQKNPLTEDNMSDDEDLFQSTYEKQPVNKDQPDDKQPENNGVKNLESEMNTIDLNENPFGEETDDDQQPQPGAAGLKSESSEKTVPPITNVLDEGPTTTVPVVKDVRSKSKEHEIPKPAINTASQITITVSEPQKIGEGMGSYMVYAVNTRTTLSYFRRQSMSVNRRFSDFLGLHSKLLLKHGQSGRIIPPPPAKSAVGTAKVKMAKDDSLQSMDFLAKRRAALERYLQRTAEHPILCSDPDFREFLELDTELPRSTSTSALSGAGMKRLFSFVGDQVNKMTFRMEESDSWFESKQQEIEVLDSQLRKLQVAVDSLMNNRKELTNSLGMLGKSTALIGHDETNVSLSCALSHLAATHEKVEKIYETQCNNDFLYLSELLRDYIAMIGAVKEAFHERVKCFQNLSTLEQTIARKRDSRTKMESTMRNDRLPQIDEEIRELNEKMEKAKEDFDHISETIKQEFERFDTCRIREFKNSFLKYMESLLETQESLIECWETFLPEAKSISA